MIQITNSVITFLVTLSNTLSFNMSRSIIIIINIDANMHIQHNINHIAIGQQ